MSVKNKIEKEETTQSEKVLDKEVFNKAQILSSKRFASRRDLLNAILKDDKEYTLDAVEDNIAKFMKGKVK